MWWWWFIAAHLIVDPGRRLEDLTGDLAGEVELTAPIGSTAMSTPLTVADTAMLTRFARSRTDGN